MLYKLFINYLRLRLIRLIVARLASKKNGARKNMSVLAYGLEFFATYLLDAKKRK